MEILEELALVKQFEELCKYLSQRGRLSFRLHQIRVKLRDFCDPNDVLKDFGAERQLIRCLSGLSAVEIELFVHGFVGNLTLKG